MCEFAKIQSTDASNRIEGIFTSEKRLNEIVANHAQPKNRNEREIAGYRDVLALIHESPDISLTTVERTLHGLLTQGRVEKVGAGRSTGYVWKG